MNSKFTNSLVIGVLVLHFLCIVAVQFYELGCFKNNRLIKLIEKRYIYPFFDQSWSMFSPNPPEGNQYFIIKFYTKNSKNNISLDIHKKILESSVGGLFNNSQRLLKYQNECYNNILEGIESNKLKLDAPNPKKSYGLASILNYSKFSLTKQKAFLEKIDKNDSIFVDVLLIDETLSPAFSKEKYKNKSFIALSNIYLTNKQQLQ